MVLRALAIHAMLRFCSLAIGKLPLRHVVGAVAGIAVLSLSGSAAWGVPVPAVGPGWDGPGLGSADLTYYFGTRTFDLTIEVQQQAIAAALGVWSSVAAVRFSETLVPNQVGSIDINFCDFRTCFQDLPGSTNFLGLAFFPPPVHLEPVAGDIFFNDGFRWEVGNALGPSVPAFDLVYIGVHESGHSLGLGHSDNPNSVMLPFVGSSTTFIGLNPDDVAGIQSIYAPASVSAPIPEPSTLLLFGTAAGLGLFVRRSRKNGARQ